MSRGPMTQAHKDKLSAAAKRRWAKRQQAVEVPIVRSPARLGRLSVTENGVTTTITFEGGVPSPHRVRQLVDALIAQ